jgi:hypothetical protein
LADVGAVRQLTDAQIAWNVMVPMVTVALELGLYTETRHRVSLAGPSEFDSLRV